MITKTDSRGIQNGKELVRLAFKSTDSKPTTGIMNGSTAIEVNTGKKYVFDEESGDWTEIASSGGGGGGGGSSDFSTAEVTVVNNLGHDTRIVSGFAYYEANVLGSGAPACVSNLIQLTEGSNTINTVLYKGCANWMYPFDESVTIVTSGDVTDMQGNLVITGDCTITIS